MASICIFRGVRLVKGLLVRYKNNL